MHLHIQNYKMISYTVVWGTAAMKYLNDIHVNINKIVRAITNSSTYSPVSFQYKNVDFFNLTEIYKSELVEFMHLLQSKLRKLFQHLLCKINTVHGHICIKKHLFSTKSEKIHCSKSVGL